MGNLKRIIAIFLLIVISGTGLSACGPPKPTLKPQEIEGKWLSVKKQYAHGIDRSPGFTIEFFSDKTVMLPSGKGTWDITAEGKLKIDIASVSMVGSLEEGVLTLTMPANQGFVVFRKVITQN